MAVLLLCGCASQSLHREEGAETAPQGLTALSPEALNERGRPVSFERQVKPILESKCLACHSGQSAPWSFQLESRELAFAHGLSGPRIVPGRPDQSLILALASTHKNVAVMPLVGNRLTVTESKILRRWVAEGAHWPSGKAGHLQPDTGSIRPEHAKMREEWSGWFDKAAARE